jgi:glucose-6-phosphate 1-dehydrogenase
MAESEPCNDLPLGIVVVGASGDLAQRKIFPALFALFCQGHLPADFQVFGLARSAMDQESFRDRIAQNLTCRYVPGSSCAEFEAAFLKRCHYLSGQYSSIDSFLDLFQFMHGIEGEGPVNRLFYMAVPPTVFLEAANALGNSGLVACGSGREWSRIVVEKPFGHDRASSDVLVGEMHKVFTEKDTFRIDHYLGKEIVQNLMILRFANLVFEPIWNRQYIESVSIVWKETLGVGQRGGYFDGFGIVRDVMQNHLLQILALLAMERPARFEAQEVRDEKLRLLRCVAPLSLANVAIGQYGASASGKQPAYVSEPTVPPDSLTATYAAVVLGIDNPRWRGVPFFLGAGKAMDRQLNEVRIRFRPVAQDIFRASVGQLEANELVIRVQPDEAIELKIMNKVPGLKMELQRTDLDLHYKSTFDALIPDAYECLLLDVMEGDRSLFIRADELAAAWDIFSPVLNDIDNQKVVPMRYPFGGCGPESALNLARRWGFSETVVD